MRLLLVLGFVLALGASFARGQEGTTVFNQDQASDQNSKTKAKKAKTDKSSSEHRRHWWSPPHWFHKKHDTAARNQSGKHPDNKTVAMTTKSSSGKTEASTTAAATTPAPVLKTRTSTTASGAKATKTGSTAKPGTGVHTATKTATGGTSKGTSRSITTRKKTTTTAGKKTVKHDCSPEEAKKGGCQSGKGNDQKGTPKPATSS
jgi:hypothetical protein